LYFTGKGSLTVSNSTFRNNQVTSNGSNAGQGGAAFVTTAQQVTFSKDNFTSNVASTQQRSTQHKQVFRAQGGGLFVGNSTSLLLNQSTFRKNRVVGAVTGAGQGAGFFGSNVSAMLSQDHFTSNVALGGSSSNGQGGGLFWSGKDPLKVIGSTFVKNI